MNTAITPEEIASPVESSRARALANPSHPDSSIGAQLGRFVRNGVTSPAGTAMRSVMGIPFNHGPALGGLAGAAAGGALGYGVSKLVSKIRGDDDEDEDSTTPAIMGSLVGAGAGALLGGARKSGSQKRAAFTCASSDDHDYVMLRLMADNSLQMQQKNSLLEAVAQLTGSQASQLARMLKTAGGAAVGALVMRFLGKSGIGGMLMGAMLGGWAGSGGAGRAMGSILGNPEHLSKTDAYGNRFTL